MEPSRLDMLLTSLREAGVDEEDLDQFRQIESDLYDDVYTPQEAVAYSWALYLSLDARLKKIESALRTPQLDSA